MKKTSIKDDGRIREIEGERNKLKVKVYDLAESGKPYQDAVNKINREIDAANRRIAALNAEEETLNPKSKQKTNLKSVHKKESDTDS